MIRVLVADDQAMIRGALSGLLDLENDIEVVAQVANGREAVEALTALQDEAEAGMGALTQIDTPVDVAILDIEMPVMDGITTTEAILSRFPGVRILIVTTFGRPGYLQRAIEAGAAGFMVKDAPIEELIGAVRTIAAGGRVIDSTLAAKTLSTPACPLTQREMDVLRVAREGGTVADIARELGLSAGTVRNYVSSAMLKLDARTRAEAAAMAQKSGWL